MEVTSLLLIYAGLLVFIGTYTDIRWREVPDWLSYAAIAAGVSTRAFAFLNTLDWSWLIACAIGIGAAFAISWLMFHAGQWGGGDAKMLIALGAILGVNWSFQSPGVAFIMNLILAGAAYGVLWTVVTAFTHRRQCGHALAILTKQGSVKVIRTAAFIVAAFLAVAAFLLPADLRWLLLLVAVGVPTLVSLGIVIKAVEQACMLKRVHPDRLTEGDWIVKDVVIGGKRITGPSDLGITIPQIRKLRALAAKGKVKAVLIKEGMPFVPSFALAFVLLVAVGNVLVWMMA
jgi:Flp pilus assembly protein protease CpaA